MNCSMLVPKGDGASEVTKGMYQFGVKKALTCLRLLFLMTRYRNLKLLCRGGVQRVFRGCLEKFIPSLEDVSRLTMLPLFW